MPMPSTMHAYVYVPTPMSSGSILRILPWVQAPGLGRTASDAVVEEVIRVSEQMIWYGTKVDRMGSVGP